MPPQLASVVYLSIVAYLFRRDMRQKPNITLALWLPILWVFISGTRFVSQWFGTFGIDISGTSYEEGSPVDAAFFGVMTLLGFLVLQRRRVQLGDFIRYNKWISFYLFFCLLACLWSDYPFVAFKRWTKLFGQIVMVLIVLTEPDPREAVYRMFKRLGYIIVPISILFIKYYTNWGRGYDQYTGESSDTGITLDKNALGYDCMLIVFVLSWRFLSVWRQSPGSTFLKKFKFNFTMENSLDVAFFAVAAWLLHDAHSSTSLVCTLVAIFIAWFLGLRWVKPERITLYLITAVVVVAIASYFDFITFFITQVLGKNMTLTDRTKIWDILLHWDINPLIGTGYESFWLGSRREEMWRAFPLLFLNSAHNGYLQTYLDMGILGLMATLALVVSGYSKARRALFYDFDFARYRLGFWLAFLFYNWTEVAFRTHCVTFFGFFLAVIDFPRQSDPTHSTPAASFNEESEVG